VGLEGGVARKNKLNNYNETKINQFAQHQELLHQHTVTDGHTKRQRDRRRDSTRTVRQ